MGEPVAFNQVNLVVGDMDAAIAFYRLLGVVLDVATDDWPPGTGARHVNAHHDDGSDTSGPDVDLDNAEMARLWGGDGLASGDSVIGFSLPSRDAVDEKYLELTAAGHTGRCEPYDAFFGARYAIVDDPDGRPIGLMSPRDAARRYTPSSS